MQEIPSPEKNEVNEKSDKLLNDQNFAEINSSFNGVEKEDDSVKIVGDNLNVLNQFTGAEVQVNAIIEKNNSRLSNSTREHSPKGGQNNAQISEHSGLHEEGRHNQTPTSVNANMGEQDFQDNRSADFPQPQQSPNFNGVENNLGWVNDDNQNDLENPSADLFQQQNGEDINVLDYMKNGETQLDDYIL